MCLVGSKKLPSRLKRRAAGAYNEGRSRALGRTQDCEAPRDLKIRHRYLLTFPDLGLFRRLMSDQVSEESGRSPTEPLDKFLRADDFVLRLQPVLGDDQERGLTIALHARRFDGLVAFVDSLLKFSVSLPLI